EKTARTRVHRGDERDSRWKRHRPICARDVDDALLERLTETFEDATAELRQLVEKEDAAMCEAQLARARGRAAAAERDVRARVMRRTKGPRRHETGSGMQQPGHGMDRRDVERFVEAERRKQSRESSRQHRFAGAWRTAEEQMMRAGCRDLERAAADRLAADV